VRSSILFPETNLRKGGKKVPFTWASEGIILSNLSHIPAPSGWGDGGPFQGLVYSELEFLKSPWGLGTEEE